MEWNSQHACDLNAVKDQAARLQEMLLADLVMLGEIPAPTFQEQGRMERVLQRFVECGLAQASLDDCGNGIGLLPGTEGSRTTLVVVNADSLAKDPADLDIVVGGERISGPFVGDNSLALAALVFLPRLLEACQVRFKDNLVLMAAARMLDRGNQEGLRRFLKNSPWPVSRGLVVESVQLGRLNHQCLGMLRGEYVARMPDHYNWMQFGHSGTILPMVDVINRISQIPLPRRPQSSLVMGCIQGGISYQNIARQTTLGFEARCESVELLAELRRQLEGIALAVAANTGVEISLDIFAERRPGGLPITHPMVERGRAVLEALGLTPMFYNTTSALAALAEAGIPGLTIGLTTGRRDPELSEIREYLEVAPIPVGMAQCVGLLAALDGGGGDVPTLVS